MFEYKVDVYKIKNSAGEMNRLAAEGWRVIAVSPNLASGFGIVVTFEREINKSIIE